MRDIRGSCTISASLLCQMVAACGGLVYIRLGLPCSNTNVHIYRSLQYLTRGSFQATLFSKAHKNESCEACEPVALSIPPQ